MSSNIDANGSRWLARQERAGSDENVHILMPSMAYACGGDILTVKGKSATGWLGHPERVTCPDCAALDRREVWRASRRQQGHDAETCGCQTCQNGRLMLTGEPQDLFDLL